MNIWSQLKKNLFSYWITKLGILNCTIFLGMVKKISWVVTETRVKQLVKIVQNRDRTTRQWIGQNGNEINIQYRLRIFLGTSMIPLNENIINDCIVWCAGCQWWHCFSVSKLLATTVINVSFHGMSCCLVCNDGGTFIDCFG